VTHLKYSPFERHEQILHRVQWPLDHYSILLPNAVIAALSVSLKPYHRAQDREFFNHGTFEKAWPVSVQSSP
jgi:hypothetical protein